MDGNLNGAASPKFKIGFRGLLAEPNNVRYFDAILDTGFTGGISIPITQALPLGLVLYSTASFTLADGSHEDTFLCLGVAILDGKQQKIVFSLTKGKDVLLGTEFLAAFNAKLELDYRNKFCRLSAQLTD
jgi:predicted aspartyl protease